MSNARSTWLREVSAKFDALPTHSSTACEKDVSGTRNVEEIVQSLVKKYESTSK